MTTLHNKSAQSSAISKSIVFMSQDNNEVVPGNHNDEALDGLQEADRKETESILAEIAADDAKAAKPSEAKKPDAPEPKGEEKKPADKKPEGGEEGKEPKETPPAEPERRESKLVPQWQLEAARNKWEKREKELLGMIPDPTKPNAEKPIEKPDADKKPDESLEKEIEDFVEKTGVDIEVAKGLVALARKNSGIIPPEISERLKKIDQYEADKAIEVETVKFNSDFESTILPLIKAEYGDDVPAQTVEKIRNDLKAVAYTPEYQKVKYSEIYKGQDQFRGVIPPKQKGGESSRGGTIASKDNASHGNETVAYEDMKEEDVKNLSDAEFDKYSAYMETYEKGKK